MHSLFIDSTIGLTVGLLDPNFKWIEYHNLDEKRPSEIVHTEIFKLLQKYHLDLKAMRLFVSSGPGSYTGMRLSEGLAQVFELHQLPVFSFYHFDVPRLAGIEKGFWATNAFKGQIFIFSWNNEGSEKQLVDKAFFKVNEIKMGHTLDNKDPLFADLISSKQLIHTCPELIFKKIYESKGRVPPYYFRSLDEEFC